MRVRRSPHLVVFWRRGALVASNYATRVTTAVTPFICQLLDACEAWITVPRLAARLEAPADVALGELLTHLLRHHLLEQAGAPTDPRVKAMAQLDPWNPEAGFFHVRTRDVAFATTRQAARHAKAQAEQWPMPAVVKRYPRGTRAIPLPPPRRDGEFPRVLTSRRTWRRFSVTPIGCEDLATLLGLTSGIQQWATAAGQALALKTSPSGGARHAIETYVAVRDVTGLPAGIYHYAPDRHALERIRGPVSRERLKAYLPNSGYFAAASAMVFFTVLFERILWRYPYSRAYRAALVEAGHLCQTFCLTATWLGLAPYCVMGLADTLIERDLQIDGIREAVLYTAGVGRPPAGGASGSLIRGQLRVRVNRRMGG
jgi:SagB-type dehydrogenase family enzyme